MANFRLAKDKILAPTCVGVLNCSSFHQRAWAGAVFRRKMCSGRDKLGSLAVFQLVPAGHQGAHGCPACLPSTWPGCPGQWQVCLSVLQKEMPSATTLLLHVDTI